MTQDDADARQREEIEWQRGFLVKVNSQLPSGTAVAAYAMLPWDLWNGPFGKMLSVTCGLWPTQACKTMLLAADQRSSLVLDLPEHPGGYPANLIPDLERLLGELREGMDAEMVRAKASPTLTLDAIEAWEAKRQAMVPKIIAMSPMSARCASAKRLLRGTSKCAVTRSAGRARTEDAGLESFTPHRCISSPPRPGGLYILCRSRFVPLAAPIIGQSPRKNRCLTRTLQRLMPVDKFQT